jgi:hypothetical protein
MLIDATKLRRKKKKAKKPSAEIHSTKVLGKRKVVIWRNAIS